MNRKIGMLIIGAAAAIAAGGVATYLLWSDAPPPSPTTAKPEEVAKYMASDKFAKLPEEKKKVYFDEVRKKAEANPRQMMRSAQNLSEKEREKLRENMRPIFMSMMRKRLDSYFELPPEERIARLDEMIDQQGRWRERRQSRRVESGSTGSENSSAGNPRNRGRRRHRMTPERLKRMIETTSPEDRAKFMEFIKAMRKRREERGLPNRRR